MRSLFLILIMTTGFYLHSQESSAISRWTVLTELGVGLSNNNPQFNSHYKPNREYKKNSVGLNYRGFKWFELTSKLSAIRVYDYGNKYLSHSSESNVESPFNVRTNSKVLALSIGGKLMLRINQGDLAIEGSYGTSLQWQKINVGDFNGNEFQYAYQAQAFTMSRLGISYTYWFYKKFGASFGLESALYSADELRNNKTLRKENQVPSYLTDDDKYHLRADTAEFLNFINLGITYRL